MLKFCIYVSGLQNYVGFSFCPLKMFVILVMLSWGLVQSTSAATSLHLKTDLIPYVRQTRQTGSGCTLPRFPAHGRYNVNGISVTPGYTVTPYTVLNTECDPGYKPSKAMILCQPTNRWSKEWQCERLQEGCVVPYPPANGKHELVNKEILKPGTTVQPYTVLYYSCKAGYRLTAKMSLCNHGEWKSRPKCKRTVSSNGCILPKMPDNGAYFIKNNDGVFPPGSSVEDFTILEYTCDKGYVVTKSLTLCQQTRWTTNPVCEKLCQKLKSDSVSLSCSPVLEDGCPVRSVINPSCKAGYRSDGPLETMTCLGGTWNVRQPKCKLITCDLKPSNTVNFACSDSDNSAIPCSNKTLDGKTIYFTCKDGYSRIGGNFGGRFCRGGKWDKPIPECSQISSTTTQSPVRYTQSPVLEKSKCVLPKYPLNGTFTVSGPNKNLKPGTIVDEFTYITYSCNNNFDPSTEMLFATCEVGKWVSPPPICRERCPMVRSLTVNFNCFNFKKTEMDCHKYLPYGSVITSICKSGHHNPNNDLEELTCRQGGNWDKPIPVCQTDCGLEKAFGGVQIVKGVPVKKDTFPWHVGIFQWDESKNITEQICGGSIIHANLVISAAHCFFDEVNLIQIDARYYKVASGKFLRSWDKDLPENLKLVQKSDVTAIYLPKHYRGDDERYQSDLAILKLTNPFKLTDSVRAVCYDIRNENFDARQTKPGKIGKVAGWGKIETGEQSEKLKTLALPVIAYEECHTEMSKYKFSRYLTPDKLCAGYLNEGAMCQGDSGGGLVFNYTDKEDNIRWYLRGVVSNGPLNDDRTSCRSDSYSAFTHIFKMRDWLKMTIKTLNDQKRDAIRLN